MMISLLIAALSISWIAPTQNIDGSPLTDLAGYKVYYGDSSRSYQHHIDIEDETLLTWEFTPPPGTWYITMTAVNAAGVESAYSNEVMKVQEAPPDSPIQLAPPTQDGATSQDGTLFVGETSKEVSFRWGPSAQAMLQLVEYGKSVPILSGTSGTGEWRFTPTRAGLYEVRISTDGGVTWNRSGSMGLVFFFQLSAPSGGGIE